MFKRTWVITGALTQHDIEWLFRSKLDYQPGEQHYLDFVDLFSKQPTKVAGKRDPATVVTNNDKEEMWLKLYFADRAILLAEEYCIESMYLPYD